jgi:lipid-A-disaccharide synthase-like uncharacterized protein
MELSVEMEGRTVFEVFGAAGIGISMLAYLPQIFHLGHEHCSAGVSRRAWAMWLTSNVLVGALAVHRGDSIFIVLQATSLISATAILLLAHRYRGMVCEAHARQFSGHLADVSDRFASDQNAE